VPKEKKNKGLERKLGENHRWKGAGSGRRKTTCMFKKRSWDDQTKGVGEEGREKGKKGGYAQAGPANDVNDRLCEGIIFGGIPERKKKTVLGKGGCTGEQAFTQHVRNKRRREKKSWGTRDA